MLGKLLKYEIKATARFYLPMIPVILLLGAINKLLFTVLPDNFIVNTVRTLTVMAQVLLIVAAFIISFIIMIQRFYKNLLCEEGYLSFTLPVSTTAHILNKLIVSLMWIFITFVICVSSILIMVPDYNWVPDAIKAIQSTIVEIKQITGLSFGVLLLEMILFAIVGTICNILMIYSALSLGHLAKNHRILTSFGAYLGLSVLSQSVSTVIISLFGYKYTDISFLNASSIVNTVIIALFTVYLVVGIIYFIIPKIILTKHLNLE